jgi:hypothetical protein
MRKLFLALSIVLLSGGIVMAQGKKSKRNRDKDKEAPLVIESAANVTPASANTEPTTPASNLKIEDLAFTDLTHDFGTVMEGPDATCVFTFKNNGTEPIVIQKAQPSCGCTVPSFSSEPVAPGATGKIDVAYHTKGKPNAFSKSITVVSNAGTKVLTIKGTVEKAPTTSVPENTSMMKTN